MIAIVVAFAYQRSRFGRRLRATREDPQAAEASGIHVHRERLVAFVISGALAGFAGGLLVHELGSITVDQVYLELTFITLAMLVVGGMQSVWGAVVGALADQRPELVPERRRAGRPRRLLRPPPDRLAARRARRRDGARPDPAALRAHRRARGHGRGPAPRRQAVAARSAPARLSLRASAQSRSTPSQTSAKLVVSGEQPSRIVSGIRKSVITPASASASQSARASPRQTETCAPRRSGRAGSRA